MLPRENRMVVVIYAACLLSTVLDPIAFLADGRPGAFNHFLVFAANAGLYLDNIVIAFAWRKLVYTHLDFRPPRFWETLARVIFAFELTLIVANFFTPVLYTVSEDNVYGRLGIYTLYTALYLYIMIETVVSYIHVRTTSGRLKFFPVAAFCVPILVGMIIQSLYYGVSTIVPFITISVSCLTACLRNEAFFKDKLTGLYNRYYLELIESKLAKRSKRSMTATMLDINGFKTINDTLGHKTGDEALIEFARILRNTVRETGSVVRYGGDEFIIILSNPDIAFAEDTVRRIREAAEEFNSSGSRPYKLIIAAGCCELTAPTDTLDDVLDKVDRRMYEDKKNYYLQNKALDRRGRQGDEVAT